ncbi:MAG: molybdopterin molybdotransferase MoeA, partial [Pseudohongiellaceae bacterium]|nr:molybdopterin molybdotransferase MoeA [Pseudohongiellaceae bacterium]
MPQLTPIDTALEQLLSSLSQVEETERLPLDDACNRVLAEDVHAGINVPGLDNSAMDGYAIAFQSLQSNSQALRVSQRIPAGTIGQELEPGTAARIFTGAALPPGADTVVIQENCERDGDYVRVLQAPSLGENVRKAGSDVSEGSLLFAAGHSLRAPDIGLLAAVGTQSVLLKRRLKVAILTTGDELARLGQPLQPGQIYNSNFYTLAAMLKGLGCEVLDCGVVADTLEATEKALLHAAENSDCIISSGGVSAGEEDHVRHALERIGTLSLWKLAIKPGKPFAFGQIGSKPFFGLPGNPVSAFVTFALLVRPSLITMSGAALAMAPPIQWPVNFDLAQNGERQEYMRVVLKTNADGQPVMHAAGSQSSGVLSAVSRADGLAVV